MGRVTVEEMRRGDVGSVVIEVSAGLLEEALGLPGGVQVTGARFEGVTRVLTLRLSGTGLPEVAEAGTPELVPVEDLERMRVGAERRAA